MKSLEDLRKYHREYYHRNKNKQGQVKPSNHVSNLNIDEIIRLYIEEKQSCYRIAIKFNTYATSIKRLLKKNNVQLRSSAESLLLVSGKNSSRWTGYEKISGRIWASIKVAARIRNLEFSITKEYVWDLYIQQNKKCVLSGRDIDFPDIERQYESGMMTASLDRIDSTKGYIVGNVQWVHKEINIAKQDLSDFEFFTLCKEVYLNSKENYHHN